MRHHYSREQVQALVQLTGGTTKALQVLQALGAASGLWHLEHAQRVEYAAHLLDLRTPRKEVVQRLRQRFSIATRTAQRDITEALNGKAGAAVEALRRGLAGSDG